MVMVQMLLEAKAYVDAKDLCNWTPLINAISYGMEGCAKVREECVLCMGGMMFGMVL